MAGDAGKSRAGARRAARPKPQLRLDVVGLAVGSLLALVAWGFLVWAAIDFGRTARGGDSGAWLYLVVASVGAVACLFLCLLLVTLVMRRIGVLDDPRRH